ncbi:MAG: DUF2269 domain-containing protein [Litorimonas sp.]
MWIDVLRWIHVLGATVLLGTGAGIAFFMVMAHRTRDVKIIAHTSQVVVIADWIFTASAVIVQPITGILLAQHLGWPLLQGWVFWSILLYVFTGLFWLPVVWIQHQMARITKRAVDENSELPERYFHLYRIWFLCGFPAFIAVLTIIWLMITKPVL